MAGIAGAIDLSRQQQRLPDDVLQRMANALRHRGPDAERLWHKDGVSLACRYSGPAPADDSSPIVVFDGHLIDRAAHVQNLEKHGLRAGTDAEIVGQLWNLHQEELLQHIHGQFAFALFDPPTRRVLLVRDRFGISPLFTARHGDWLLFASEIKGLLASGLVKAAVDRRGINHLFTFFALPGPITCFEGVASALPAHYLDIRLENGVVQDRVYWHLEFPDRGQEVRRHATQPLVDGLEQTLTCAVARQLDADKPVVCYLSGGIDSSIVAALAAKVRGEPLPAYTIRIEDPALDESNAVAVIAQHLGYKPIPISCGPTEIFTAYPQLVHACEMPVIDMACSALLMMAERVHADGYGVALSGEGADEWFASYPWYKFNKLLGMLDVIPGVPVSRGLRQLFLRITGSPRFPKETMQRARNELGGQSPWLDAYGLMSMSKLRFFSPTMREVMVSNFPYGDLHLDRERSSRWHPLHRALYMGTRVHLPGLLLATKNDRPAHHASVQPRFPFLDEDVCSYLARLHPNWKLLGFRDKYLLRLVAERLLPKSVVWRNKALFRAPSQVFAATTVPPFVDQLMSAESLRRADYFDPVAVAHWRSKFKELRVGSTTRSSLEMGLAGVLSTQLWHHLFIDSTLCELPGEK